MQFSLARSLTYCSNVFLISRKKELTSETNAVAEKFTQSKFI